MDNDSRSTKKERRNLRNARYMRIILRIGAAALLVLMLVAIAK